MLGTIAGDIIGSAWEGSGEKRYDFPLFTEFSRYTDDTVMTIAIAVAVLDRRDYTEVMREIGARHPFAGYGRRFHDWLLSPDMPPPDSYGNGGAMRMSAIGLAAVSEAEALAQAQGAAAPSHGHPEGIRGAQAVALAVFLARSGASKDHIRQSISSRFGYNLERTVAGIRPHYTFSVAAERSVPEAILSFLDAGDYESTVRNAVSLGGDADTMACIAGGIAEAYWGGVPASIAEEARSRLPEEFIAVVDRFYERYPLAARDADYAGSTPAEPEHSRIGKSQSIATRAEPRLDAAGAMPLRPIADAREYRLVTERLVRQLTADVAAAALVRELERVLRYEIEHGVPDDTRLASRLLARPRKRARRTALISDIHGNHAGLLAALEDIEKRHCDRILCLGDLVDGGPENERVIETMQRLRVPCVRGNHDETNDLELAETSRRFLLGLPEYIIEDDVLYIHISPRPRKRKINHAVEAWNVFEESDFRLLFIGHVHVPMIFGERSDTYGEAAPHPFEYNRPFAFSRDERYIISIGAIGYGRDDVGRIRYAIYDAEAHAVELRAIDGPLLPHDHTLGGCTLEFS
ncbi:MAG: hypothetical protein A3F74_24930 [Betaproteobacteria bacterium RIFCSPLOWO2_12_FULL_62_58]|nr:MAG: hypothetical protein A3I62_00015 [Betaproteobacteria bacterium RIFCSPLOWO2_02_FULL_62_79]OGA54775.1 MAG: hypothetical protein A3F74_24930 [Betaproteobacteria bacterium RIFCSPLOWO2_12_FULL_62_58]